MLKNYLTAAFRNLWRNKTVSVIHIAGLSIGLSCCVVQIGNGDLDPGSTGDRGDADPAAGLPIENLEGQPAIEGVQRIQGENGAGRIGVVFYLSRVCRGRCPRGSRLCIVDGIADGVTGGFSRVHAVAGALREGNRRRRPYRLPCVRGRIEALPGEGCGGVQICELKDISGLYNQRFRQTSNDGRDGIAECADRAGYGSGGQLVDADVCQLLLCSSLLNVIKELRLRWV